MTKIRVVQISSVVFQDDIHTEYLDDKGRVWTYKPEYEYEENHRPHVSGMTWKQLDLPDEPTT